MFNEVVIEDCYVNRLATSETPDVLRIHYGLWPVMRVHHLQESNAIKTGTLTPGRNTGKGHATQFICI